jgi:tRNA-splicing ligase RtcB
VYDVAHNIAKFEWHETSTGRVRCLVHRKGATRAFPPGHPELPEGLREAGQPVLIGGSMGTASYVLAGNASSTGLAFCSACHGAGRSMSRNEATRRWSGRRVVDELRERGILVRSPSLRGVAEEAPGAYKAIEEVVESSERAGLARRVARVEPMVCVKG